MMKATCFCGKVCKNLRGLRIYQTKMGYVKKKHVEQQLPSTVPGETEEEQDWESTYSVQNLQGPPAVPSKPSEVAGSYGLPQTRRLSGDGLMRTSTAL